MLDVSIQRLERIVFCDFDGTITCEETFIEILEKFTPELYAKLKIGLAMGRITLRKGVRRLLESIPSSCYPHMVEFVKTKQLRPGFTEFLDFLKAKDVPIVIVSAGLRDLVISRLGDLTDRIHAIYGSEVDTRNKFLKVISNFEHGSELMAKRLIMEQYNAALSVAIGDSLSDFNMTTYASIAFARDSLALKLKERQIPFEYWEDFYDIKECLGNKWQEKRGRKGVTH